MIRITTFLIIITLLFWSLVLGIQELSTNQQGVLFIAFIIWMIMKHVETDDCEHKHD